MTDQDEQNTFWGAGDDAPIHLVISRINGNVWIKPSRSVNRQQLLGLVMDAVFMLQSSTVRNISPEDCRLRVMLTVDEEQPDLDKM